MIYQTSIRHYFFESGSILRYSLFSHLFLYIVATSPSGLRPRSAKPLFGGSNPPVASTIMPRWWNGRHEGLKILCLRACEFDSRPRHQNIFSSQYSLTMSLFCLALLRQLCLPSSMRQKYESL